MLQTLLEQESFHEQFFPNFDIRLQQNNFFNGEAVKSKSASGTVEFWDDKTNTLRISSVDTFVTDEIIRGSTSRTEGVATEVRSYESYLKMGATSEVLKGHQNDSGFLNANMQRWDSDYYQTFAYSINSRIPFDTWDDVVSSTNHTIGYKKFADYQLESTASINVGLAQCFLF